MVYTEVGKTFQLLLDTNMLGISFESILHYVTYFDPLLRLFETHSFMKRPDMVETALRERLGSSFRSSDVQETTLDTFVQRMLAVGARSDARGPVRYRLHRLSAGIRPSLVYFRSPFAAFLGSFAWDASQYPSDDDLFYFNQYLNAMRSLLKTLPNMAERTSFFLSTNRNEEEAFFECSVDQGYQYLSVEKCP